MWTVEQLHAKRAEILAAAACHGAHNVRIFGSVARGEAHADSDVDFLVELEPGRSLFDLGSLMADLEDFLECPVDLATDRSLHPLLRERILHEAVRL